MSVTNELREYAKWSKDLLYVADRIDAAHKQAVDKAHADGERNALQQHRSASEDYRRGYEAGKADGFDEGFASADDWLAEHADAMAEHGWVELPKDADGVPIRVGDVMAYADNTKPMEVVAIAPPAVFQTEDGPRYADMCRHYHEPTVEDVLRKFYEDFDSIHGYGPDEKEVVEKYAKRLQIKEADE